MAMIDFTSVSGSLESEVPDGNWGAAGQVIRFAQLRELAARRAAEGAGLTPA